MLKNIAVFIGTRLRPRLSGVRFQAEKHGLPSESIQLSIGWVSRALSLGVKPKDYFPTLYSVEIKNDCK
jgi:hypothetical protein